MSRSRIFLTAAVAALPLLAVIVLVAEDGGKTLLAGLLAWLVTVTFLSEILWRRTLQPLAFLLDSFGLSSTGEIKRHVHQLEVDHEHRESERADLTQLIEDISTGLGEGLLVIDPKLHLRLANPKALHFLGVNEIESGASLLELEREPEFIKAFRDALDGEKDRRIMVENPRGVWEIRPFPLSRGGAVALVSEVGELHRAAELRRRFVQDLSHEIRSPLTVMRTTVEAMEDDLPVDISQMMVRQVERITRLTDELYELASIEAGTLKITAANQPVAPILEQICSDFRSVAEQAEVDLRNDFLEDFSFEFDKRALSRVVSNLVDNAIKYNRPGGWVKVTATNQGSIARFAIEDSGLGIPASELGAVMQRFYRVDRARTPGSGGLGLGLAIVKHMVQQMGGDLTIDSREDVGTRVMVSFPIQSTELSAS